MEVQITSKQIIKPSSSELHLLKPFKLSFSDQLGISMYSPGILFYAKPSDSNIDGSQFLDRLKQSLSKALTQFYPVAAFSRGSNGEIPNPELLGASSRLFPPIEPMPESAALKSMFFDDGRHKRTRSFVFDANAITTLVLKAKSKSLEHPSRAIALSAFLWKHAIQASRSVSGTLNPAILCRPVNIRPKLKPGLPSYSIGNMFVWAISMYNPVGKDIELSELAYLLREAAESTPNDPQVVQQGFKTMTEQLSHVEEMVSQGDAELLCLSS
ncbi:hypothetical protein V6N11_019145 [Hibiscus sabdariffa]|uniref:Uncharacterized protein n=1 Tax=Hibiscus sabdariffa TaxID=183260 RepID=A0ABR2R1T7_9ROSI